MAKASQTTTTTRTRTTTVKVRSTKANPKSQSRCPVCGKYMRKKSG